MEKLGPIIYVQLDVVTKVVVKTTTLISIHECFHFWMTCVDFSSNFTSMTNIIVNKSCIYDYKLSRPIL